MSSVRPHVSHTHAVSSNQPGVQSVGYLHNPLVLPVRSTLGIRIGAERPTLVHTQ